VDTAELSCCPEREGLAAQPRSSGLEASRDGAISLAESTASITQALVAGPFATATATAEAETARARPSAAAAATVLTAVSFALAVTCSALKLTQDLVAVCLMLARRLWSEEATGSSSARSSLKGKWRRSGAIGQRGILLDDSQRGHCKGNDGQCGGCEVDAEASSATAPALG